jgi:hypothetical protein
MNSFIYNIPTKVYFGENQLGNLGKELTKFGKRVLLTYGGGSIKRSGLYDRVIAELRAAEMEIFELSGIEPNPRIDSVREGVKIYFHNPEALTEQKAQKAIEKYLSLSEKERMMGRIAVMDVEGSVLVDYAEKDEFQ